MVMLCECIVAGHSVLWRQSFLVSEFKNLLDALKHSLKWMVFVFVLREFSLFYRRKIEAKRKGPETGRKEADRVFDRLGIQSRERRRERSRERRPERSTSGRNKGKINILSR